MEDKVQEREQKVDELEVELTEYEGKQTCIYILF